MIINSGVSAETIRKRHSEQAYKVVIILSELLRVLKTGGEIKCFPGIIGFEKNPTYIIGEKYSVRQEEEIEIPQGTGEVERLAKRCLTRTIITKE